LLNSSRRLPGFIIGASLLCAGSLFATGLEPAGKAIFRIPLDKQEVRWIKSSGLSGYDTAEVAIAVPAGFDPAKVYPVLVTCVTGDHYRSNLEEMDKYWPLAIESGWVVVTGWADPDPERDTKAFRRAVSVAAMRQLQVLIPSSKNWPVATAGFSGGGKNAAVTAAYLQQEGYRIIGLFMGGCNQDLVTFAMKRLSPDKKAFREIPVFISSGTEDKISTPSQSQKVLQNIRESGFPRLRFETYPGGHVLERAHVPVALKWFDSIRKE
jgi:predicted esterase